MLINQDLFLTGANYSISKMIGAPHFATSFSLRFTNFMIAESRQLKAYLRRFKSFRDHVYKGVHLRNLITVPDHVVLLHLKRVSLVEAGHFEFDY